MIVISNVLFQMLNSNTNSIRTSVVHAIIIQPNISMRQERMSTQGPCTPSTCITKVADKSCHGLARKRKQHTWQTVTRVGKCPVAQQLQGSQKHLISNYYAYDIYCFSFKFTIGHTHIQHQYAGQEPLHPPLYDENWVISQGQEHRYIDPIITLHSITRTIINPSFCDVKHARMYYVIRWRSYHSWLPRIGDPWLAASATHTKEINNATIVFCANECVEWKYN